MSINLKKNEKITFLVLLLVSFAKIQAQNYQIDFVGTGITTLVDSVKVENLTQCTAVSLGGNDILNLNTMVGIPNLTTKDNNIIQIYPNPTSSSCLVNFEATAQGETSIELIDITGKKIIKVQEILTKGYHLYRLSGISSGIYILVVASSDFYYTSKIASNNTISGIPEISHVETKQSTDANRAISNGKLKSAKSDGTLFEMKYTTGDILKLTGKSGIYRTIFMLVPTQTQIVNFNFVACIDTDGNNYSVVKIGTQTWMAECMKTTKYNDGTAIPNVTDNYTYFHLSSPAYSWYNNSIQYKNTYGALYNWYVVGTGKICPTGWHVPDSIEWETMFNYLGGEKIAGGKMKEACSSYWETPNVGATNSSGFSGIPSGCRDGYTDGNFYVLGYHCYSWASTEYDATNARFSDLTNDNQITWMYDMTYKRHGFSIRCMKDQ